ncbi:hypothetical protein [Jiangella ureilytica]|nr:hypothetical protein [Jiangella ureilytica]
MQGPHDPEPPLESAPDPASEPASGPVPAERTEPPPAHDRGPGRDGYEPL